MGRLYYRRDSLVRVLQEVESTAALSEQHLPKPEPNSDTPPSSLPGNIARGLIAVATFAEEAKHDNNTTAVADAYGITRFRLIRLRNWMEDVKASDFRPYGIGFSTEDEDLRWSIFPEGPHVVLEFSSAATPEPEAEEDEEVEYEAYSGSEEEEDAGDIDRFILPEGYHYSDAEDVYVYYSKKAKSTVSIPGEMIREMKSHYSNHGGGATMNFIARKFGVPRPYFTELKTLFGWTKDQSIYTAEELIERDLEGQDRKAVEVLERQAMLRFESRQFKEMQRKARRWDELMNGAVQPFIDLMKDMPVVERVVKPLDATAPFYLRQGKKAAVVCPFDLHYGKREWAFGPGEPGYTVMEFEDLVRSKTAENVELLRQYGLSRIIIPLGHDYFHVMNDAACATTSHGTPQETRLSYANMIVSGSRLLVEMIEMYRGIAPIDIVWVPGNHDTESSVSAMMYMAAQYSDAEDVKVHIDGMDYRTYLMWEGNLIGNIHGDGIKKTDLPRVMAQEVSRDWGHARNRMFFVGHLHFEQMIDQFGTQIFQAPSLSGSDRWHYKKLFVGARRSLDSYIIHETAGKIHQDSLPVEQTPRSAIVLT